MAAPQHRQRDLVIGAGRRTRPAPARARAQRRTPPRTRTGRPAESTSVPSMSHSTSSTGAPSVPHWADAGRPRCPPAPAGARARGSPHAGGRRGAGLTDREGDLTALLELVQGCREVEDELLRADRCPAARRRAAARVAPAAAHGARRPRRHGGEARGGARASRRDDRGPSPRAGRAARADSGNSSAPGAPCRAGTCDRRAANTDRLGVAAVRRQALDGFRSWR